MLCIGPILSRGPDSPTAVQVGSYPSTPSWANAELRSVQPVYFDRSLSGKRFTKLAAAHRWEIELNYPILTKSEWWSLSGFLHSLKGRRATFTIILPDHAALGVATGTPVVAETGAVGTTLDISGCTPSTTNWLRKGDLFQIAGNNKVYRLTENADSDGSGLATLEFEPALVSSPANGSAIAVSNIIFSCSNAKADYQATGRPGKLYEGVTVSMIEVSD